MQQTHACWTVLQNCKLGGRVAAETVAEAVLLLATLLLAAMLLLAKQFSKSALM